MLRILKAGKLACRQLPEFIGPVMDQMVLERAEMAVLTMGCRIVRNDEVVGSIPTSSTMFSITYKRSSNGLVPLLS